MPDTCSKCGRSLTDAAGPICSACATAAEAPTATKPTPKVPHVHPAVTVAIAAFGFAWLSNNAFGHSEPSLTAPGLALVIGAAVGLAIGGLVASDNFAVQRRLAAADFRPTSEPGNAVAVTMLIIPLIAGLAYWLREPVGLDNAALRPLAGLTIASTAVLGYIDRRGLVLARPADPSKPNVFPVIGFVGMMALWVLSFPAHFIGRRRLRGPNLIVPALAVTAVFFLPAIQHWFRGPELPPVDSPVVTGILSQLISEGRNHHPQKDQLGEVTWDRPEEVAYDRTNQLRTGKLRIRSGIGVEELTFQVEWADASRKSVVVKPLESKALPR